MKVIGEVLVESGQLCLIKKRDMKYWPKKEDSKIHWLGIWGRDSEEVIKEIPERKFNKTKNYMYFTEVTEKEDIEKRLAQLREKFMFVGMFITDHPFDKASFLDGNVIEIMAGSPYKFYNSETTREGIYDITETPAGFICFFDLSFEEYDHKLLDVLNLKTPEEYTFIDPCHIDTNFGSITVLLEPGEYQVQQLVYKNGLPKGLSICKVGRSENVR